MVLRPRFWTRSSLLFVNLAAAIQEEGEYSRTGLTAPVYTVLSILELAPHLVPDSFLITASRPMSLSSISSRCGFQVRRGSSFTPRNVGMSTWGRYSSPALISTLSFTVDSEKTVATVLDLFSWSPQLSVHSWICSTVFCILYVAVVVCSAVLHIARSSACRELETWRGIAFVMSLM